MFSISLLNYCITSNHNHIIAVEHKARSITRMMHKLEGDFAGYYNRRKQRSGSFWEDRYHCTMIEDGEHFHNCMIYVDMNMVRAGVVTHPRDWTWCGYLELVGEKDRYRLLDIERVLVLAGSPDRGSFRQVYEKRICEAIECQRFEREPYWTESIAVGSMSYLKRIADRIHVRRRYLDFDQGRDGSWFIRDPSFLQPVQRRVPNLGQQSARQMRKRVSKIPCKAVFKPGICLKRLLKLDLSGSDPRYLFLAEGGDRVDPCRAACRQGACQQGDGD